MTETFGQMLRKLRERQSGHVKANRFGGERHCLSQTEVARRAEIDVSYVNRLERGLGLALRPYVHVPLSA